MFSFLGWVRQKSAQSFPQGHAPRGQKSEGAPTEIPAICKKTIFTVRGVKYWNRFPGRLWTLHPGRVHKSSAEGPEQPGLTLKLGPPEEEI